MGKTEFFSTAKKQNKLCLIGKKRRSKRNRLIIISHISPEKLKGRFLKFGRYHNFANLFSKLSETTFYKEISKFQSKV